MPAAPAVQTELDQMLRDCVLVLQALGTVRVR